jgi:hypothetical protein
MLTFDYHPEAMDRLVPPQLHEGLRRYIEDGVCTGSGLISIITDAPVSQVMAACDMQTRATLKGIIEFLYGYAPANAHGSQANMADWISKGGIRGQGGTW